MRINAWGRTAIAGCGVAAMLAVMPVAAADTTSSTPATPSYAPITLSPQDAQQLCTQFLPKLSDRTTKLITRFNGGADVRGSLAWLKARADAQRAKGHTQAADQLDQRAQHRTDRLNDLKSIQQRLTDFKTANCKAAS